MNRIKIPGSLLQMVHINKGEAAVFTACNAMDADKPINWTMTSALSSNNGLSLYRQISSVNYSNYCLDIIWESED